MITAFAVNAAQGNGEMKMTKFEEEAKEKILNTSRLYIAHEGAHADVDKGGGIALKIKDVVYVFPWLEFARNWHSDEEFQAKEKEIKRLRKINHLYKKAKGNAERMAVNNGERLNQAQNEIAYLKSQLQQQALPVVKDFVAVAIESIPDDYSAFEALDLIKSKVETLTEENKDWLKVYNWLCEGIENQDIFALAFITRKYEVEKPQLFRLKHIDISKSNINWDYYLKHGRNGNLEHYITKKGYVPTSNDFKFTQQEIDSMQTGSYEQIEV